MSSKQKTVAVHAGTRLAGSKAVPVSPPIYPAAVNWFDSSDDLDSALDGKDYAYARISAPNTTLLEEAVAALEGAEDCVAYASGMAALRSVFEAQGFRAGDKLVMPADGYGVTRALYKSLCATLGVELHAFLMTDPEVPERIRALKPRMVLAESISNPLLRVPDLRVLARACQDVGATFVVDGTFPSPVGQRALALGADYAVQSTSKWLNGHSDALGGTVSASRERMAPLRAARVLAGDVLGPFEAWLTLRGLRTLPVRMKAHVEHAAHVARRLMESPLLERVIYPGLTSHPDHATAQELLLGGGPMVAFEIKGAGRPESMRFLEALKVGRPGPSLGDVCTLVMHAASASARRFTPEEREAAGIRENLIRVSVGLEDPDDIVDDLLAAVAQGVRR
ncbi:Cys/Met metabolism PLP-dependent enzyme [Myxococcus xanthus DK 1622]|uniref:Cys/Met metabolism PLP-dependent enzyme n=1 Tax=Myxococcus xanthus (strain DK1622) TaxID=246197 RepID=Q1DAY0_MYXXD|nr:MULTISPECIES: aminotransferase class I/II-fold pyridoxal phosphate-dependent enzyme [Myxococcus]ABF87408.1 Cys/Met metabolism PLP-dependent enzyme [Myxococcus xanthus DK 1622]NOJ57425.1 aminotransferase class I/II-fold pyridoxal phosphate-dependent enzyme [Myxococcus xanthus]QPM81531.1 aminotransferase class I/II-fold pyridoxal phosphate-dependent enzyme [Myxococcus xanthus]QVW70781.1 aminotransferase class I/II-fold pyridoxal phosphate-dependent enzyme [Myxococcus xanthus DZ2]QZZ49696.1 L-